MRLTRALLLLALLLAACADTRRSGQESQNRSGVMSSPAAPAGAEMFTNPVIDGDFPDPDLLKVGDTYYAYATNFGSTNIQMARSTDLVTWQILKDALPVIPNWARPGFTWAPEVTTTADGKGYVMYFTARHTASEKQCIGVAISASPEGPFRSNADQAFICQLDEGGSIDPASFVDDDGTRYVLWKNDGNCCSLDTWIYIQRVSDDGLTLLGTPTRLIKQDQSWEGNVIEAPTLTKHQGTYYLFYSANSYAGDRYAVGYATADDVLGPYTKAPTPLLATTTERGITLGPGGQDIVADDDGDLWMVYHAWDPSLSYRHMNIDELVWEGDRPVVKGPDRLPQPRP